MRLNRSSSSLGRTAAAGIALALAVSGCEKAAVPAGLDAAANPLTSLSTIIATCAVSTGEVKVRRKGLPYWEDVTPGVVFRAGDWVKTGPKGFARIEFLTSGKLELDADAVIIIDTPSDVASDGGEGKPVPMVAVESGNVRAVMGLDLSDDSPTVPLVIKNQDGSRVRLEAKKGEEPVEFLLSKGDKGTQVAVTKGEATVVGSDGTAQEMRHGQVSDMAGGQASAPADLIAFPESLEPGIDARFWAKPDLFFPQVKLGWSAVPGATGYRVQIGRDLSFQTLLESTDLGKVTSYQYLAPEEGVYTWHVASRDAQGRYGEFGFARRFYLEREKPKDLLIGPEDGATVTFIDTAPKLTFSWQSSADAKSYRLVINSTGDLLRKPVLSVRSNGQRVQIDAPPPGEYQWGVFIEGKVLQPIFLKPRHFVLRKGDKEKAKLKGPAKINKWGE
ncbi:MAG: hypothetical protein QM765_35505 [Myxococcales bacterium]